VEWNRQEIVQGTSGPSIRVMLDMCLVPLYDII
jgi:hypothetical protein